MTLAERLLAMCELKPFENPLRVCDDCLATALKLDPTIEVRRLTRHDKETLRWKCHNRGCYNKHASYMVDADAMRKARLLSPVRESVGDVTK